MNSRAIEATLLPHLDSAYNLARWLTGNDDDAHDVTQEAFARAIRFFATLEGDAKPWLLRIVRNTFYTLVRQGSRHGGESFDEDAHSDPHGGDDGPEFLAMLNADAARVRRAIESLSPEYREAIVLRELEGMSYADIADAADVPIGTVMSRISRARGRMQEFLRRGDR